MSSSAEILAKLNVKAEEKKKAKNMSASETSTTAVDSPANKRGPTEQNGNTEGDLTHHKKDKKGKKRGLDLDESLTTPPAKKVKKKPIPTTEESDSSSVDESESESSDANITTPPAKKAKKRSIVTLQNDESDNDAEKEAAEKMDDNSVSGKLLTGTKETGSSTVLRQVIEDSSDEEVDIGVKWYSKQVRFSKEIEADKVSLSGITDKLLGSHLREKLKERGIHHLYPVQKTLLEPFGNIPHEASADRSINLLYRRNLYCTAPMGSGKTLAYVLPIIQSMLNLDRGFPSVFALVVSPTEDEANAACTVFRHYMDGTRFNVASITGAASLEEEADALVEKYTFVNKKYFTSKVDIVVATPGRFVEHLLSTDGFSLRKLRFLVLDGADRLVDMSWLGDVEKCCSHLHEPDTSSINNQLGYDNTVILQQPLNKVIFSTSVIENSKTLAALKLKKPVLLYTTVRGMKATKAMELNKTKKSGKKIMLV